MQAKSRTVFRFAYGGFFEGYDTAEVLETAVGYKLRCEHGPFDASETTSDLPAGKVEKLRWFIDAEVNSKWYCRYVDNVLDGTQRELFDGSLERYGSNLFPQGFGDLTCFLARELGCQGFDECGDVFETELDERQELEILASYGFLLPDTECQEDSYGEDDWDDEDGEEAVDAEMTARQLRHDLHLFLHRHPGCKDYGHILAENGVYLDVDQIKAHDVRDVNPECIVAMVLAMSRAEHFDGWSGNFGTCAKDGTFGRRLARLGVALGQSSRPE